MSLAILNGESNIFMRTYRTTRDLTVLYLDGSSAVMTTTGTLDLQDVLIEGSVSNRDLESVFLQEYGRAQQLCESFSVPRTFQSTLLTSRSPPLLQAHGVSRSGSTDSFVRTWEWNSSSALSNQGYSSSAMWTRPLGEIHSFPLRTCARI